MRRQTPTHTPTTLKVGTKEVDQNKKKAKALLEAFFPTIADAEEMITTTQLKHQFCAFRSTSPPSCTPSRQHPNGILVLDEYVDFASLDESASLAGLATESPNLVFLHIISKALGLAGIRLGAAWAHPPIACLLNALKSPWNTPYPSAALASHALSEQDITAMRRNLARVALQRERLLRELMSIWRVGQIRSGTNSKSLMFEVLMSLGVLVRFRGEEVGDHICLRVTVGAEGQNDRFLNALKKALVQVYSGLGEGVVDLEMEEEQVVGRDLGPMFRIHPRALIS
ncbi:pyridoxal phosphate-dependent transferase [Aspergillus terricola var. indicus]